MNQPKPSAALIVLAALLAAGSLAAQDQKPLTNDDILQMVAAGFGEGTIIKAIESNKTAFDTSLNALVSLKNAGVSEAILQAMMDVTAKANALAKTESNTEPGNDPPPDLNDPKTPRDAGIYWLPKEKRDKRMVQLEPSVYSQGKSGGMFASAMTYGIAKAKWKAVVRSSRANLRISEGTPEFWFYFETQSHGLSYSGYFVGGASSPNEFILAKMDRKSKERELVVGEFGSFGSSTGTRSKDVVEIEFQRIAPGIYRVVPTQPLRPGEYCFFYAGTNMAMGMAGGKLFDFGVDPAK